LTARSDLGNAPRRISPARRFAAALFQRLVQLCLPSAFDRYDERRARRLRQAFGRRGRLLSWHRQPDGSWRARLSCADLPRTIERAGRSRGEAIDRADHGLKRVLSFRRNLRTSRGWTVRPHDDN
jgi:hypothetical protein